MNPGTQQAWDQFRARLTNQKIHTVNQGDTLYSIAKQYGLNIKALAANNQISPPYMIKPGQKIKLKIRKNHQETPQRSKPKVLALKPPTVTNNKQETSTQQSLQQAKATSASKAQVTDIAKSSSVSKPATAVKTVESTGRRDNRGLSWQWPASGKIIGNFAPGKQKINGLQIANSAGTPIYAAANGEVVYSGDALRGYGNLIIIKHAGNLLTAYAHNQKIVVKEKQTVKVGQLIAYMGNSGSNNVKLHFEVRKQGTPIDPLKILPKK